MLDAILRPLLRPFVARRCAAFECRYGYDMAYARELFEASPRAFLQFAKFFGPASFSQDLTPAMLHAAKFAAARRDDCGPCAQLVLDMAAEAGVPRDLRAALVANDVAAMPADMALAWRYAQAAVAHAPELPDLRDAVVAAHGRRALASLALAVVASRTFPALKYALGHGRSCQRLSVESAFDVTNAAAASSCR